MRVGAADTRQTCVKEVLAPRGCVRVYVWKQTIVQRLPDMPVTSRASGVTVTQRPDLPVAPALANCNGRESLEF